jgi:ASPIC and UnbV
VDYGNKVQPWAVLSQSCYYSCNDPRRHFGLGASTQLDAEVQWRNGSARAMQKGCCEPADHHSRRIRDCEQPCVEPFPEFVVVSPGTQESHDCRVAMLRDFLRWSVAEKVLDNLQA